MGKVEKISISLPIEMVRKINKAVDKGEYATVSEVVRTALRIWENERAEDNRIYKMAIETYGLNRLKEMVQEGADSGPGIDIDEAFSRVRSRLTRKWGKGIGSRKAVASRTT